MTLDGVADQVHVTKQAVSKYENGMSTPSSGVLLRLSQALDVSVDFLIRPTPIQVQAPRFRALAKATAGTRTRLEAYAQDVMERRLELESIVYGEQVPRYAGIRGYAISDPCEAEAAAIECRMRMSLGEAPIADMVALLESSHVRTFTARLDAVGMDGLSDWATPSVPYIVELSHAPGDRQRFTLAHELGHIVLGCPRNWTSKQEDAAANRFAAAFLVPATALRDALGGGRKRIGWDELLRFKEVYRVSMGSLVMRTRDIGIITKSAYSTMWVEMGSRGWKTNEPVEIPREPVEGMRILVERALCEKLIGPRKAAELLAMPYDEFVKAPDRAPTCAT